MLTLGSPASGSGLLPPCVKSGPGPERPQGARSIPSRCRGLSHIPNSGSNDYSLNKLGGSSLSKSPQEHRLSDPKKLQPEGGGAWTGHTRDAAGASACILRVLGAQKALSERRWALITKFNSSANRRLGRRGKEGEACFPSGLGGCSLNDERANPQPPAPWSPLGARRETRGARTQASGARRPPGRAHGLVSALMRRLAARGAAGDAGEAAAPAADRTDCARGRGRSPWRYAGADTGQMGVGVAQGSWKPP